MTLHKNNHGYTLIELLIASTIFAVILLGAAATLLQINKMYYKGVITSRTQDTSRKIIDEISRNVQFSDQKIVAPESSPGTLYVEKRGNVEIRAFCIGSIRYTYTLNAQVSDDAKFPTDFDAKHRLRHALWQDTINSPYQKNCVPTHLGLSNVLPDLTAAQPSGGGRELLGRFMRLKTLTPPTDANNDNILPVTVGVVYGDDDTMNFDALGQPTDCKGSVVGGQWCAFSELSTEVFKRIQSK
jgi:prepilin-type N-terminal cleavage/methylation domain-containing protein